MDCRMVLGRRCVVSAVVAAATAALVVLLSAGSATASPDIAGTWSCCGAAGGAAPQYWIITAGTGSLSGKGLYPPTQPGGPLGAQFAKITGKLVGDTVTIITTYAGGGYVATFYGTVSAGGRTMSGKWSTSGPGTSPWTATRATAGSTPTPVLGRSVAAATVSGQVLVKRPGTTTFVPLTSAGLVPVGATVDATNGRVAITAAAASGHARNSGQFYGGEFLLAQSREGVTDLKLTGGRPCATNARSAATIGPRRRMQKLWGTGHGGNFKTTGRYAAATVLGTRWLTENTCMGTTIRVVEGVVRVADLVLHRTILLHAPATYTAKP
jgi:hypothetical protein